MSDQPPAPCPPPARTYLVTGAAGFIGSHVCDRLLADGQRVRAVDRFSRYYDRATKEANLAGCRDGDRFELVEADLADADIARLLAGVDGVIHLAAQPGVRASWGDGFGDYVRDNVVATQRLFEALAAGPVPTVYASSSSVYGDAESLPVAESTAALRPVSPYGLTKLTAEHLARIYTDQFGVHAVGLRYFTVYGPRQRPDMAFTRLATSALEGRPLRVFGDGTQSRDFTFVGDAVDATLRALAAPAGRVYNIGGGEPTTLNSVLDALAELVERPVQVVRQASALGDVAHTWADTTLARAELGWRPSTTLAEGLARQVGWLQERRLAGSGASRAGSPAP